ncbi:MAG: hypothetical protein GWO20_04020 [Candidatus Korarchaeota archaeon]|nr:hypothetical protein [Candidatus Korarchaeota archaeon]
MTIKRFCNECGVEMKNTNTQPAQRPTTFGEMKEGHAIASANINSREYYSIEIKINTVSQPVPATTPMTFFSEPVTGPPDLCNACLKKILMRSLDGLGVKFQTMEYTLPRRKEPILKDNFIDVHQKNEHAMNKGFYDLGSILRILDISVSEYNELVKVFKFGTPIPISPLQA